MSNGNICNRFCYSKMLENTALNNAITQLLHSVVAAMLHICMISEGTICKLTV